MLFLVVDPTLGKKKNGYGVYFKETTSHLRSDWLIKNKIPHFFARFFVVVLGGVVFRFPNNLEKNLNKSFRKSYFLTF